MKYQMNIINHLPERFFFVGTVPIHLSYTMADGSELTDDMANKIRQVGAGLFKNQIKHVVFKTKEDAQKAWIEYHTKNRSLEDGGSWPVVK